MYYFCSCLWVSREINSHFRSKLSNRRSSFDFWMGTNIWRLHRKLYIFSKTFLWISHIWKITLAWIRRGSFHIYTPFHFADFGLHLLNGLDFYFDLFWMAWHYYKPLSTPATLFFFISFANKKKNRQTNRNTATAVANYSGPGTLRDS